MSTLDGIGGLRPVGAGLGLALWHVICFAVAGMGWLVVWWGAELGLGTPRMAELGLGGPRGPSWGSAIPGGRAGARRSQEAELGLGDPRG